MRNHSVSLYKLSFENSRLKNVFLFSTKIPSERNRISLKKMAEIIQTRATECRRCVVGLRPTQLFWVLFDLRNWVSTGTPVERARVPRKKIYTRNCPITNLFWPASNITTEFHRRASKYYIIHTGFPANESPACALGCWPPFPPPLHYYYYVLLSRIGGCSAHHQADKKARRKRPHWPRNPRAKRSAGSLYVRRGSWERDLLIILFCLLLSLVRVSCIAESVALTVVDANFIFSQPTPV
jgi:hypothetical protein